MILLIVLVEKAARMGNTASAALIFPDATSEAIAMAAECVSTKPAAAAAMMTPASPNHSRKRGRGDEHGGKGQREYQRDREAECVSGLRFGRVPFAQGPEW